MEKRGRRGVFQMSFGMIFSIFIIAATMAVAIYAIIYFLDFKKCSDIGLFYEELEEGINGAWRGEITKDNLKSSIGDYDAVCFGNLTLKALSSDDGQKFEFLQRKGGIRANNIFIYPPTSECKELNSKKLEHVNIEKFFCIDIVQGKVEIRLEKNLGESLVTLSKV